MWKLVNLVNRDMRQEVKPGITNIISLAKTLLNLYHKWIISILDL